MNFHAAIFVTHSILLAFPFHFDYINCELLQCTNEIVFLHSPRTDLLSVQHKKLFHEHFLS